MFYFTVAASLNWRNYLDDFHHMLLPVLCRDSFTMEENGTGGLLTRQYCCHGQENGEEIAAILTDLIYEVLLPWQCAYRIKEHADFMGADSELFLFERLFYRWLQPSQEEFAKTQKAIKTVLDKGQIFPVDGFVRWGMGQTYLQCKLLAEYVMRHYIVAQEYQSFIYFLRMLAREQSSGADEVVISEDEANRYIILDGACGTPIPPGEELLAEAQGLQENDLLLSRLLSLSPRHILLDASLNRNDPIIMTICQVFPERISILQ